MSEKIINKRDEYLIESIKNKITKISSIFIRFYLIKTINDIAPCAYCEAFKKSNDFFHIKNLGQYIGLDEQSFELDHFNADWVDSAVSNPPYTKRLTPEGCNFIKAYKRHIYNWPTIEVMVFLKQSTKDNNEMRVRKRFEGIGKIKDGKIQIDIFFSIINWINSLVLKDVDSFFGESSMKQRYMIGNNLMAKKFNTF